MAAKINNKGFSLMEVLIAVTLFGVFISVYLSSQGYNIADSISLKEENTLRFLTEMKINEIILNPPEFSDALENRKEKKEFDLEGYKEFEYEIEYKKLNFPNLSDLIIQPENAEGEAQDVAQENNSDGGMEKVIFEKLKENLDMMVWQVRVTVTNKTNDYKFTLSTWIQNTKAQTQLNVNM